MTLGIVVSIAVHASEPLSSFLSCALVGPTSARALRPFPSHQGGCIMKTSCGTHHFHRHAGVVASGPG
jgi:hypothetical protein